MILDRYSIEAFVNRGEQAMTAVIPTNLAIRGISFHADERVIMDVEKFILGKDVSDIR